MRRSAAWSWMLLLAIASAASAGAAGSPSLKVTHLQGSLECGATAAAGVATDDRCNLPGRPSNADFLVPFEGHPTAIVVEIAWVNSQAIAGVLRMEFPEPVDARASPGWEGPSPGRVVLRPVASPSEPPGGELPIQVRPPAADGSPSVTIQQTFRLVVSVFHGVEPPVGFSALDAQPDDLEAPPVGEPAPPHLVPSESSVELYPSTLSFGVFFAAPFVLFVPRARRLVALLAAPLFTRLDEDRVLNHPRRSALLEIVRTRPGIGAIEVRRALDVGHGSFDHHLRILVGRGLLRRIDQEGRIRLFAGATRLDAVAPSGLGPRVLAAVQEAPGQRQIDLARVLAVPEGSLRHHVIWLARRGRLRLVREGREVRCYPVA